VLPVLKVVECEGSVFTMQCPNGTSINVERGYYGRKDRET